MRYVILGAGAVGASIGGLLAQAGRDVLLVARGAHRDALRRDGLTLARPGGVVRLHLPVADSAELSSPAGLFADGDIALLCTKTQDSAAVLDAVAASPRRPPVVCAQNGVENERLALRRLPDVYSMVVNMPATHLEPGVVRAEGSPYPGLFDLGRYPGGADARSEQVRDDLRAAGFRAYVYPDVMRWKYGKLLRNLGNVLEVLCGPELDVGGHSRGSRAFTELYQLAMREGRAVLATARIDVASRDEEAAHRLDSVQIAEVAGYPRGGGSTWQSATRGASLEVDYLNGEIVLIARTAGIEAPVNALLQARAAAALRSGAAVGSVRPEDLLDDLGVAVPPVG